MVTVEIFQGSHRNQERCVCCLNASLCSDVAEAKPNVSSIRRSDPAKVDVVKFNQRVHIAFASFSNKDVVEATPELPVFAFAKFAAKCTFLPLLHIVQIKQRRLLIHQSTGGKQMRRMEALRQTRAHIFV